MQPFCTEVGKISYFSFIKMYFIGVSGVRDHLLQANMLLNFGNAFIVKAGANMMLSWAGSTSPARREGKKIPHTHEENLQSL